MPKTYRRDIIVLFIGKLIVLIGLFMVCFSPKSRPAIGASQMTKFILNTEVKPSHARS